MGELCAVTSHSTLLPVMAALYTRIVPLEFEEGRANRQGSKQVLNAQQPCSAAADMSIRQVKFHLDTGLLVCGHHYALQGWEIAQTACIGSGMYAAISSIQHDDAACMLQV